MLDKTKIEFELGCRLPREEWLWLNGVGIFEDPGLRKYVAPFPPPELMQNVSGLSNESDFAAHGNDIFTALEVASPRRLAEFARILDFGCGCGRLARMFKGHPHQVFGCDIDERHVRFVNQSFDHMTAKLSQTHPPLPYPNDYFDAIISISVFTHLNERSQDEFLADLHRVSAPGAFLFLTTHGGRALQRALEEDAIWKLIAV